MLCSKASRISPVYAPPRGLKSSHRNPSGNGDFLLRVMCNPPMYFARHGWLSSDVKSVSCGSSLSGLLSHVPSISATRSYISCLNCVASWAASGGCALQRNEGHAEICGPFCESQSCRNLPASLELLPLPSALRLAIAQ